MFYGRYVIDVYTDIKLYCLVTEVHVCEQVA